MAHEVAAKPAGPQKLAISSGSPAVSAPPSPDTLPVRLSNVQSFPGVFVPEYPVGDGMNERIRAMLTAPPEMIRFITDYTKNVPKK